MRRQLPVLIAGWLVIGVGLGLLLLRSGMLDSALPTRKPVGSMGEPAIGGRFTLTDHNGRRVTEKDFSGRYMLVFFGFTFCPDICPTALQVSAAALDKIGARADRITPLFISVDPERDTPEQLKSYVASFHPRLVGLTGSREEVAAAARTYRAYWRKVTDDKSAMGYAVDHSSIVYLMGPDGRFITHFTHATSVEAMAAGIARHL